MIATLALRNVLRNPRRSAITVTSIAVGLAAVTFMWGFVDGMNRQMVENATRSYAGDAQIHAQGYHADPSLDRVLPDATALLAVVRGDARVAAASPRLEAHALASRRDRSRAVKVVGLSVEEEADVSRLLETVVQGASLEGRTGAVIGDRLGAALGLEAGGEITLVGQAYDGSVASGRYPVLGLFRTGIEELDAHTVAMPLDAARELYAAAGIATAVVVRLRDREGVEVATDGLAALAGPRHEVLGWPQILPMVAVSLRFHDVVMYVVLAAFLAVVAAAVANPVLMAVLERTQEFGVLLAMGASGPRLLRLVLAEAALLGIAGLVGGNALGLGITAAFSRTGIDLGAFEAGMRIMPGVSDVVYPAVEAGRTLGLSAVVFATATLAALYPALAAARLDPVAAIRGLARPAGTTAPGGTPRRAWPVFMTIAGRNLLRHRRRTAIMVGGVGFSIFVFVFTFGFFDGFFDGFVDNSTRYLTGHVQLERAGFRNDMAPELALDDPGRLLERVREAPNVAAAAPRVQAQALASSAARSQGILLIGVDPASEREVTVIHRALVAGRAIAAASDREIVIGRELARRLDVGMGQKIVVMAQAADGELASAAFRIGGIFATESPSFDGGIAFVGLSAAQSLLGLGERVSTINVRLAERSALERSVEALRDGLPAGVAITPWQELLPELDQLVRFDRIVSDIVLGIFILVVATAIMNTVFMAVAERSREFGVMMALGAPPAAIARMVVYETLAQLGIAIALGYALGIALVVYAGAEGIDLSGFFRGYSAIPGLTGIVHPKVLAQTIVAPGIGLLLMGVLVSLYPAAMAGRLDPAAAIRRG